MRTAAVFLGLGLGAVSVFLDWASIGSFGFGPMDAHSRFRLGDWLGTDKIDGYAVLAVAALGLVMAVLQLRPTVPRPWLLPGLGGLLVVMGVLNIQYVNAEDVSVGLGLYVLVAGGVLAAVSPLLPDRQLLR